MKPSGPVFDRSWREACSLTLSSRSDFDCNIMVRQQHYLHRWPGVCTLVLKLQRDSEALGVVVFALPPRETSKRYGCTTWELARLWLNDGVPQNGETWLIAAALRYVRRHHPDVKAIVSYADPSAGHSGVIYRAANFRSDGRTDQERKTPRFDYADARTGKRYSRRAHVPAEVEIVRVPRVSKWRYVIGLSGRI